MSLWLATQCSLPRYWHRSPCRRCCGFFTGEICHQFCTIMIATKCMLPKKSISELILVIANALTVLRSLEASKIQPTSNRPVNSISKGWGCELSAGFSGSTTRQSLAGWSKLPKHSQPAHHRPKSAPSSKSMNSVRSSLKKISMLALASGRLHLWQGPRLCLRKKDDQNG